MCCTCYTADGMVKMIQVRNVPDDIHRKLKVKAAQEGVSLSDLLLREAVRLAERPTIAELTERIRRRRPPAKPLLDEITRIIREDRGPLRAG